MTDRDNEQGWAADPQVTEWLGAPVDASDEALQAPETPRAEATSEDAALSADTTIWAQNSAISGWLAAEPPESDQTQDGIGPQDAPDSGYDAQITAPMEPITATQSKQGGPSASAPAVVRPTVVAAPVAAAVDPQPRRVRRRPDRRTVAMAGAVLAAVGLVLGVILTVASFVGNASDDGGEPIAQPPAPSAAAFPPAAPADDADCPNRTEGGVITGRDPGDTTSGPAVIKAFEHAYYVERNGAKARSYGTELARMGSAASMQTFIDTQLPPGTLYCTRITDRGAGLWSLELSEIPPGGGEPVLIRQLVQTAQVDGRTLITAITKDTNQ